MCGILGVISPDIHQPGEFYNFASNLFIESQIRGTDASGFAALCNNEFITDKRDVRASDFTHLSKKWRSIRKGGAISMIAHTRAATSGQPRYNANNHPFHGPRFSMAHNGTVGSHREIANDFKFKLKSSCDSELILHFLESKESIREGIIETLNWLDSIAMMAVCVLDRKTGIVHLFREKGQPMEIVRFRRWNAIVFASTGRIIHGAAAQTMGSHASANTEGETVYKSRVPDYTHIQVLPSGEIKQDVLDDALEIKDKYTYSSYYGMLGWGGAYSRRVKSRTASESSSETHTKKTIAEKGDVELENSSWNFRCFKCGQEIDDRGPIHEVGADHMCGPCYAHWSDDSSVAPSEDAVVKPVAKRSTKSKTPITSDTLVSFINKMNSLFPLEFRIGLGEETDDWPTIMRAMQDEREPALDHNLDHIDMQSYFRHDSMSIEEKQNYWFGMTLRKITMMDDGEYLSYFQVMSDALNAC